MADNIQATPRNEFLGLLSDAYKWMQSPERAQQMQGFAGLLGTTGVPQTIERMAYGEPLANISRANVPLLKPETADALMTVAPFAPKGMKMIRATEGMPVGMSIKPINLNKGIYKPELTMEEMLKVKDIPTVERVQKSIDLVGEKEFENMVNAQFKKYKPTNPETEAMLVESVTLNILGRAQRSPYPQQAALDLAQQRAALPVSEGGLGLPANNTPEMRAKAMGFDVDLLHGTAQDFPAFDLSKAGTNTRQAGDELGIFSTSKPFLANDYAQIAAKGGWANRTSPDNPVVYPLVGNFSNPKKYQTASQFYRDADAMAADQNLGNWRRQLQQQGYDSVFVRPDLEEVVAFNPDQLRSRFAAFDPFRKDVATATAMGVALPDLLAAEPTPQNQSSGLLYPFP